MVVLTRHEYSDFKTYDWKLSTTAFAFVWSDWVSSIDYQTKQSLIVEPVRTCFTTCFYKEYNISVTISEILLENRWSLIGEFWFSRKWSQISIAVQRGGVSSQRSMKPPQLLRKNLVYSAVLKQNKTKQKRKEHRNTSPKNISPRITKCLCRRVLDE